MSSSAKAETAASSSAEDKKAFDPKNPDLGLLEEDDEFEEFPAEDWDSKDEDQSDANVWEDNWDDDNVEDDFSVQLKKHGRKRPLEMDSDDVSGDGKSARSPHLRSPEPVAKKLCSRPSPKAAAAANGNGSSTNGSSSTTPPPSSPSRSRRSGSSRQQQQNGSNSASGDAPRTPTRSSARLRSSRK